MHHHKSRDFHCPEASTPPQSQAGLPISRCVGVCEMSSPWGKWRETHSAGMGIALESAVAATVEAGRWTIICGEIAAPTSLKKKMKTRARKSGG